MQFSKCFLVVCASASCMAVLPLRAADADTNAMPREALEKKLNELQTRPGGRPTPPGQWTPPPVVGPALHVAQPRMPAPSAQPRTTLAQAAPATAVQPTPQAPGAVPPPVSEESVAKAREDLRQKMNQLEAQPPALTNALASAPIPAPKAATSTPTQKRVPAKLQGTNAIPAKAQPKAQKLSQKPAKARQAFPAVQAPPPAISASKEARLAELLRKYKADEITPEEYHQQRAKIMSEP